MLPSLTWKPTKVPPEFVSVSVSAPQLKIPFVHVSLPVVALHVWRPEPNNCEDEAYDVFSKGNDVDVPVVVNVVLPIAKVPLVKEMVVLASTTKVLDNSSKFNELDVTPRPEKRAPPILSAETLAVPETSKLVDTDAPDVKLARDEKLHAPVTISF